MGMRRCDSRCHNAKKPRCRCWCGGHYHGAQGAGNRDALVQAVNEADQALLLQQHGFKQGETKYVQQLELKPKPMKHYLFKVTLSGYGDDLRSAWDDATEQFAQDPGAPDDEDYTIEEDEG